MSAHLFRRLERNSLVVLAAAALGLFFYHPQQPRLALGVVGGGALAALAYWAIRGVVDGLMDRAREDQKRGKTREFALVKFFTRHAILAFAGYGMMTRLDLHPIGLLIGVSVPAAAVAIEAVRAARNPSRP